MSTTKNTAKPSPLPWTFAYEDLIRQADGGLVAKVTGETDQQTEANGKLICDAVNEREALLVMAAAAEKFYQYYFNDLAKNNPGFIAKLYVQDYGAMNDAYCAIEQARAKLAKARKGN